MLGVGEGWMLGCGVGWVIVVGGGVGVAIATASKTGILGISHCTDLRQLV